MNHLIFWEGSYTWPISSFALNRSFLCKTHFVRSLWFAIRGKLTFGFGMDLEGKELDPFLADIEQWKPPKRIQPSHRSRQYRWPGKYESSVTRYRKKIPFLKGKIPKFWQLQLEMVKIQFFSVNMAPLLNKPYVNEVTLIGQKET